MTPVTEHNEAKAKAETAAATEAQRDRYRLHRRRWDEDKGPVPKEDQEKYTQLQTQARELTAKVNAESQEFKDPSLFNYKMHFYQELFHSASDEHDSARFVEKNKKLLERVEIDGKDFEGKRARDVMEGKYKEFIQRARTNKARKKELGEEYERIDRVMRFEVRHCDVLCLNFVC